MHYFYDDVNDWLSVGGDLDLAKDLTGQHPFLTIEALRAKGVTHVLDVRSEWEDKDLWVGEGLDPENYCHAPIVDNHRHSPEEEWFRAVEDFVLRFWTNSYEGDRLYIHCHMGINRAPSAAMLALLTVNPLLHPMEAFLAIRDARPAAGLVYAESVGARHIIQAAEDWSGEFVTLEPDSATGQAVRAFLASLYDYWTPELMQSVNKGIAYYRTQEGGTVTVGA